VIGVAEINYSNPPFGIYGTENLIENNQTEYPEIMVKAIWKRRISSNGVQIWKCEGGLQFI
jgi:hypothetical protein